MIRFWKKDKRSQKTCCETNYEYNYSTCEGKSHPGTGAAALENVKDLDDDDAIPELQALAAQTDDPDEKAALLDVANYLALPSVTEAFAQHHTRLLPKNSTIRPMPRIPGNANRAQAAASGNQTRP